MIWPFLFAVLFVIFGRSIYKMCYSFFDYFIDMLLLGLLLVLVFGLGIGFSSLVGLAVPKHWAGPETVRLVSFRDRDSIDGTSFLGTASIGTAQYYFFYKEAGQGYQPDRVAIADNVVVFEEKRQNGELKVYTYQFVNQSLRWVAWNWQKKQKYEFVIPEGSLKKSFVLQ